MFDDNETSISFNYYERFGNEKTDISMEIKTGTYTDIVEKFRWFLQSIGYSYIANVAVYGEDGEELYSTTN